MNMLLSRVLPLTVAAALGSTAAAANPIVMDGIESIDLDLGQNVFEIRVHNASDTGLLKDLDLAVKTTKLTIPATGQVKCSKGNSFDMASIGFGAFNPTFLDALVVHKADFPISAIEWTNGQWLGESMGDFAYEPAVASLKDPAKPDYQVDPLAEIEALLEAHLDQNGSELGFYRNDQQVVLDRTISVIASCWTSGVAKARATITKPVSVKVIYEGDPELSNFKLNAIIQNSEPGGFAPGYNPMDVTSAELIPFQPVFKGNCPAEVMFRTEIKGSGKGTLRYRILEGSSTVHQSETLPFSAYEGTFIHDFAFPVEWEGQQSLQKKDRSFKLYVSFKDESEDGVPTMYNMFDIANWSHQCLPKLNIGVGADMGTVQMPGGSTQGSEQAPTIAVQPIQPSGTPPRAAGSDDSTARGAAETRDPAPARDPASR